VIEADILWDLGDEQDGNVQHINQHGIRADEVEAVLRDPRSQSGMRRRSGHPQVFGWTPSGRTITVVWRELLDDPQQIYPVTAYEVPLSPREVKMSRASDREAALTPVQPEAAAEIRSRLRHDQRGPDELIDQGEIEELVPQPQFMELRTPTALLRQLREEQGLSLTDVSERSGLTRAAVSRLENGWNVNPTLDTLFRYAAVVGAYVSLSVTSYDRPLA
jgi:DNA-binding XRE family transcriptional regulator